MVVIGVLVYYVIIFIMIKVGAWVGEGGEDFVEVLVSLSVFFFVG